MKQTGKKSRDTLGAMAGVSGKTYEHATAVLNRARKDTNFSVFTRSEVGGNFSTDLFVIGHGMTEY